jgi:hypothetical protein
MADGCDRMEGSVTNAANLIIYASKSGYDALRDWMSQQPMVSDRLEVIVVSAITQLEVLG